MQINAHPVVLHCSYLFVDTVNLRVSPPGGYSVLILSA